MFARNLLLKTVIYRFLNSFVKIGVSLQYFDLQGPIECKTEYQTTCSTSQLEHQVEEDVPHCVVEEEE